MNYGSDVDRGSTYGTGNPQFADTEWQTNWQKCGSKIAIAIYKLNTAANLNQKARFNALTMNIVKLIRATLYCSNTMDREAAPVKDDTDLKTANRSMIASLAKLVISANVASSDTLPDGSSKMQADSNELLTSVRNFVEICQEHDIAIKPIDPSLSSEMPRSRMSVGSRIQPRHVLPSDMINSLQAQQDATTKTVASVQAIIADFRNRGPNRSRQELVAQFRNCINQISKFLNILQDIETYKDCPQRAGLQTARQGLYDDLGSIFITVQTMTDPSLTTIEDEGHISLWLNRIDEHMRAACEIMQGIVHETEDLKSVASDISEKMTKRARGLSLDKVNGNVSSAKGFYRNSDGSRDSFASALHTSGLGGMDMDSQPLEPFTTEAEFNKVLEEDDAISEDSLDSQGQMPNSKLHVRSSMPNLPPDSHTEIIAQIQRSITSPDLEAAPPSAKQDKLKKFFGEEAAAEAATSGKSTINDTPSFLGYDYDPAEIVVNMEGDVKGGTLTALTERLTSHKYLGE